jgi:hypothetical protein
MNGYRLLGAIFAICTVLCSAALLLEMRPEIRLIAAALMIVSVIGLIVVLWKIRSR